MTFTPKIPISFAISFLLINFISVSADSQRTDEKKYEPNLANPFGLPNPHAPAEIAQFAFLIGENDCTEEKLNNSTGEWESRRRTWDAKYFLNGYGIIDSGRSSASTNANTRIYDEATQQWHVTYFSMPTYSSGVWSGGLVGEDMVLKQPQKAPGTDFDGFSRLTFNNISDHGFDWIGEWISEDETVVFPFWRVSCEKTQLL